MILKGTGVFRNLAAGEYYPPPYYSASAVRMAKGSARNLKASLTKRSPKSTPAMEFGTAFHTLCLEPEIFATDYVLLPDGLDFVKKEGKDLKKAAIAEGKTMLKEKDLRKLEAMRDSLMSHPWMAEYFDIAMADVEISLINNIEGCMVKSRLDTYFPELGMSIDLKTTMDASPGTWKRQIRFDGYRLQAAIYVNQLKLQGLPARRFVFAAVEKDSPHTVGLYEMSEASLEAAWQEAKELFRQAALPGDKEHYNSEPTLFDYEPTKLKLF